MAVMRLHHCADARTQTIGGKIRKRLLKVGSGATATV